MRAGCGAKRGSDERFAPFDAGPCGRETRAQRWIGLSAATQLLGGTEALDLLIHQVVADAQQVDTRPERAERRGLRRAQRLQTHHLQVVGDQHRLGQRRAQACDRLLRHGDRPALVPGALDAVREHDRGAERPLAQLEEELELSVRDRVGDVGQREV